MLCAILNPLFSILVSNWQVASESHLMAVRKHLSPVKSRDFTAKVCNPGDLLRFVCEIFSNCHWRNHQINSRFLRFRKP